MDIINLQDKALLKEGIIEHYWFENENIGLEKTLFHRIIIPLKAFDSGLEYVEQPERTELIIEWIDLGLEDPTQLSGVKLSSELTKHMESSIYIGNRHNWVNIHNIELIEIETSKYKVEGKVTIEFETEGVAKNEDFQFSTTAKLSSGA